MKFIQSSYFRAAFAAVIGILILCNPLGMLKITSIAMGILFLLTGLYFCYNYYQKKIMETEQKFKEKESDTVSAESEQTNEPKDYKERVTTFSLPVVGMGSTILGLCLTLAPSGFISLFMYVLGGIIILGALNQFFTLYQANKYAPIATYYWAVPTLLLLAGLFIIINPLTAVKAPLIIVAISLIVYAVSEVMNSISIEHWAERRNEMRRMERSAQAQKEETKKIEKEKPGEYVNYIVTDED
ncbi:MAG: DUF308 domain-containing protein [Prevotella sp.]|nr:DUF308 domain-containing protein [Prevotella sp.]